MNPLDFLTWVALVVMTVGVVLYWAGREAAGLGLGAVGSFAAATVATADGHTAWALLFAGLTVLNTAGLLAELGKGGAR